MLPSLPLPCCCAGLDVYNINMTCAVPPLCTDMTGITTWLNTPSVQQALGVKAGITWAPCNDEVRTTQVVEERPQQTFVPQHFHLSAYV